MTRTLHSLQKVPVPNQRRITTLNQRVALFRHLAQMLISLGKSMPVETLSLRDKGRLQATSRLLLQELKRILLRL